MNGNFLKFLKEKSIFSMKQEEIEKIKEMIDKLKTHRENALYRALFGYCVYLDELINDLENLIKDYE